MVKQELLEKQKEIENVCVKDMPLLAFTEVFTGALPELKNMHIEDIEVLRQWIDAFEVVSSYHPEWKESATNAYVEKLKTSPTYQSYLQFLEQRQNEEALYNLELEYVKFLKEQELSSSPEKEYAYTALLVKLEGLKKYVSKNTFYIMYNILLYYNELRSELLMHYGNVNHSHVTERYHFLHDGEEYQKFKKKAQ